MDCDGPKHILLHDVDGSLMVGGAAGGSIIARAEYFSHEVSWPSTWHKRDPKTLPDQLLVDAETGDVLTAADVVDEYGIVRSGCTRNTAYNAHECPGGVESLRHRMLVIESMDSDHEERSLIPVALRKGMILHGSLMKICRIQCP